MSEEPEVRRYRFQLHRSGPPGGTHQSVDPEHLDRYLAEATTRFNGRRDSGSTRFASVTSGVIGKRITYRQLIGKDAIG